MGLISVTAYNFRNLENAVIETGERNVFLVGENGQGKTNFLEAVYTLCFGNSFRTKTDSLLIREGEREMSLRGVYSFPGESPGKATGENNVFLSIRDGKKNIQLNGKRIGDRKEIIHNMPCVVFSHEDIFFVNGPPEKRRVFFNQTISLFDFSFLDSLRRYERILKNRNAQLREASSGVMDILDSQLVQEGINITEARKKVTGEFNATFSPVFSRVSGIESGIKIIYRPSWNTEAGPEEIIKALFEKREIERAAGTTLSGPHRDRFYYFMDKRDFTKIASTGQTRLVSLALKTAQAEFYRIKTGKKPLVLLDDVLLELDKTRKIRFIDSFPEYEQAFFTFLPGEERIIPDNSGIFYSVENGAVRINEKGRRHS